MTRVDVAHAPAPPVERRRAWVPLLTHNLPLLAIFLLWPLGAWLEDTAHVDKYHSRILCLIGINVTLAVSLQLINGISGQFSLGHAGFMAVGAYLGGYATAVHGVDAAGAGEFVNPAGVLWFFVCLLLVMALAGGAIALVFAGIRFTRRLASSVPAALMLLVVVWIVFDVNVTSRTGLHWYSLWSQAFDKLQRFYLYLLESGASPAWRASQRVPESWLRPLTLLISLVGGGALAAVAGLVVGLPTLRLKGDYLAIATLGFAEIIRVCIVNCAALGGATGLSLPIYAAFDPEDPSVKPYYITPWILGVAVLTTVLIYRLAHSAKGRAIAAVREDEIAAAAVGIDTTRHKIIAFVVGAFFAGVAGSLYAHLDGYLNTNSFGLTRSIEIVVIVTLGGLGSIRGATIAAIVLTFLPEFLRSPLNWGAFVLRPFGVKDTTLPHWLPVWLIDGFKTVADNRMIVFSALLVVLMVARSKGYFARKPRGQRRGAGGLAAVAR